MKTKIKLIWDFRGSDALAIAEHHKIHLQQFITRETLEEQETGVQNINPKHSIAYMMVSETEMLKVRDALKPHRGERIKL